MVKKGDKVWFVGDKDFPRKGDFLGQVRNIYPNENIAFVVDRKNQTAVYNLNEISTSPKSQDKIHEVLFKQ